MRFPFARALRIPARTRSTMRLRSSSATAPNTVKTILPVGVDVSSCSNRLTNSIPSAWKFSSARKGARPVARSLRRIYSHSSFLRPAYTLHGPRQAVANDRNATKQSPFRASSFTVCGLLLRKARDRFASGLESKISVKP